MTRNNALGVIGGGLIVLAVFLTGTGFDLNTSALKDTTSLVLFLAGLGVALCLIVGMRTLAAYCAVAATTLALVEVINLLRADTIEFTVRIVVLIIGVLLALMASVGRKPE
jgi:hypothetical protein